ncbi:YqgE/AlgH family protein [Agarilytica rhodophyticola]|uniref:YqgE/AlgH family protein n=1 Tax=Agarilytica rhodophyticola TaxID=1737490 RepID=UPI000B34517A|nr:YqgE/AlgH family protein [Agarilytica rhodophyticola]
MEHSDQLPQINLRDHFLIAMPALKHSIFSDSITYICDHSAQGAMGIVLNQPMDIYLNEVFDQLSLEYRDSAYTTPVLAGGPVNRQQGFVLHRNEGNWDSTLKITDEICLTASRDIVNALAADEGPDGAQFALGYAGWSAGQLEDEISENSWLTIPANNRIIFDIPAIKRRDAIADQLGIDLNLISDDAGHA